MARPLAPRCVTTYGHLDALGIVFLSRPCTTVRGVVSILVYQIAPQHGKGNSAQPCVHILSSPEGHRETMNKECPRVYLNGLRCARCSVPVFHPGAQRCKLHAKGSHSWMRIKECPARVTYCLGLKPPYPRERNHTAAYPAVIRGPSTCFDANFAHAW